MARFLKDEDYDVQARSEILSLLDDTEDKKKILQAESTAISQMKKRLGKRYDVGVLFTPATGETDTRDPFIVMTVIDITLYHLWSGQAAGKIPKFRENRYQDAVDWLKEEGAGEGGASDMPEKAAANYTSDFRIVSRAPENNKW